MSAPDLSLVLETSTAEITGRCDAARNLSAWTIEAASVAPRAVEVLLVGPAPFPERDGSAPFLRTLVVPGAGYYALKNAGANEARGRVVLFSDLDCRPEPGYVRGLLARFDDDTIGGVAGRSLYDGTGLLTAINSASSFGHLNADAAVFEKAFAVAHNLSVRRDLYERDPWGPFDGRLGGDGYLSRLVRRSGRRLVLDPTLVVRHEDPTWRPRGLVERHLRDTFIPLHYGTERQRYSALFTLACALGLRTALRLRRALQGGRTIGLRLVHAPVVLALNAFYWLFDLMLTVVVLSIPPLRRRWLAFLRPNALRTAPREAR